MPTWGAGPVSGRYSAALLVPGKAMNCGLLWAEAPWEPRTSVSAATKAEPQQRCFRIGLSIADPKSLAGRLSWRKLVWPADEITCRDAVQRHCERAGSAMVVRLQNPGTV